MNPVISTVLVTFVLTISLICSIISVCLAVYSIIELKAMQKSTHSVQFTPMDPKWASSEEDLSNAVNLEKDELLEVDPDELDDSELDLRKLI